MSDLAFGIVAIAVSVLFCFLGAVVLRAAITIWGAFVGFSLGAGVVAGWLGEGFLAGTAGWVVGVIVAVLFAWLAYAYYAVAVLIAVASLGFATGVAVMAALGITWNWLVVAVAMIIAVLIGIAALSLDVPSILLVVLSTLGGASVAVSGVMLIVGVLSLADFTDSAATSYPAAAGWWWTALYLVLVVGGIVVQGRASRKWQSQAWDASAKSSAA